VSERGVRTAFLLCAGQGKRLRPLTDQVPKPLVPLCGIPLVEFALARIAAAGVERIVINTHRLADEFIRLFPDYPGPSEYAGVPVFFRHEPELLETAGGLKNVEDLLLPGPVLVHNGDILTDLDLGAIVRAHEQSGGVCTLGLRSSGGPLQVGFDAVSGRVTDIRGELGSEASRFLYTGVCVVGEELLGRIPAGRPLSFVPVWLEVLRSGGILGGAVLDGGEWRDIGTVGEYVRAHSDLAAGTMRITTPATAPHGWPIWHPPGGGFSGWNWLGPDTRVAEGAVVENSILWAGASVESGAVVRGSVVREGMIAAGQVENTVV
jgi:mannose-1-phosphate guanylyltransferase